MAWRARTVRDLREGRTPSPPSRSPAGPPPVTATASTATAPTVVTLDDACRSLTKGMKAGTIRTKKRTTYKPSVIQKYESMLRVHALDPDYGIGALALAEIDAADARDFINALAGTEPQPARPTRFSPP